MQIAREGGMSKGGSILCNGKRIQKNSKKDIHQGRRRNRAKEKKEKHTRTKM